MTDEQKEARSRWRFTLVLTGIVIFVPLLALGAGTIIRRALQPRVPPRMRSRCKRNLREIGLACHAWADDHDDRFPPNLESLVPDYVDNPRVYSCPSAPSRWQDFNGGLVTEESSSYEYLPGRVATLPGDFFLAYDRSLDNHGGAGFNVVYCDAHVEWRNVSGVEKFNKLLDAQEEVVKAINSDSGDYEQALRKYRQIEREVEAGGNE